MTYRLDPARIDLAREFIARPYGIHSDELQRALNLMRGEYQPNGRLITLCMRRHKEWVIGRMGKNPLDPIVRVDDRVFSSFEDAEWAIFKLRWKELTGEELTVER